MSFAKIATDELNAMRLFGATDLAGALGQVSANADKRHLLVCNKKEPGDFADVAWPADRKIDVVWVGNGEEMTSLDGDGAMMLWKLAVHARWECVELDK